MTTNTKAIIEANKRHIISQYGGRGGKTGFIEQVDYLRKGSRATVENAIREMVEGGSFLIYNDEIIRYLKRIGLKDEKKIIMYRGGLGGPLGLYTALLVRDGSKLYRETKKK